MDAADIPAEMHSLFCTAAMKTLIFIMTQIFHHLFGFMEGKKTRRFVQ